MTNVNWFWIRFKNFIMVPSFGRLQKHTHSLTHTLNFSPCALTDTDVDTHTWYTIVFILFLWLVIMVLKCRHNIKSREREIKQVYVWCCHCCFTGSAICIFRHSRGCVCVLFACKYKIGNRRLSNWFCSRFFNLITNSSAINYSGQRNMHPTPRRLCVRLKWMRAAKYTCMNKMNSGCCGYANKVDVARSHLHSANTQQLLLLLLLLLLCKKWQQQQKKSVRRI